MGHGVTHLSASDVTCDGYAGIGYVINQQLMHSEKLLVHSWIYDALTRVAQFSRLMADSLLSTVI